MKFVTLYPLTHRGGLFISLTPTRKARARGAGTIWEGRAVAAHRDGMLRAAEIADSAAEVAQTLADRCRDGSLDHTLHSFVARNYRDIAGQIRATAIEAAANEATIDTAPAEKEHERWDYRKYSKEKIRK